VKYFALIINIMLWIFLLFSMFYGTSKIDSSIKAAGALLAIVGAIFSTYCTIQIWRCEKKERV